MRRAEVFALLLKLKELKLQGIEVSITMSGKAEISYPDGTVIERPLWAAAKVIEAETA